MVNTPKIRFKGFNNAWEQHKVTDLLKNSSSAMKIGPFGSALKKEFFVEEGIKVYAQENAFTGDFSIGNYYITEEKYHELQSCELYPGDLVISMMGTIGACAIFPETAEKGIMNSHLLRLQFSDGVIPEYIMFLLRDSDIIRTQIDRLSVGSIMSGLSSSVIKKLIFPVPQIEEQKKIVNYLELIDNLITLHQRKCDETKELKKYMLQKMFPQNSQKYPEIRFAGFTDDWKQCKVLDLLIQPITDGPHETPKLVEKGIPFISVDAIVNNKIDFGRKRGNISEEYDELCCKKYKPQLDDVYLVKSGSTVGKVAIVETTERFNIWSPLAAMRCGDKSNPYFLYYLLQTDNLQAQVLDKASNGTQPNLSMRELERFNVCVPDSTAEQKKLGMYFRSIDILNTLHQRKCDELKEVKKFMLQNMFPQKG